MIPDPAPTLRQLLTFYLDAGVDCALADEPINRLVGDPVPPATATRDSASSMETAPARPQPSLRPAPPLAVPTAPASPEAAIVSAREAAATAPSLEALRALMRDFEGCALRTTATQLVFADGNPQARLMLVGEAPGRDEDIEGLPFIGRAGKLLELMLAAIGLDRTKVYITNVIPWRPPGNRDPSPHETQICLPFIRRQIELVDPDILVPLGKSSTNTLLGLQQAITRTRGRWFDYQTGTRTIRALPTLHPAYLLRQPTYKRLAWQDLRAIAAALAGST
jgi:uracil-DNA glycosylase